MNVVTGVLCVIVAVLIVARVRWLARHVGWSRVGHELRRAITGGF